MRDRAFRTATVAGFAALAFTAGAAGASSICGDVDGNNHLTATDALSVLKAAVGQPVKLLCAPPSQPTRTGQTTCSNTVGTEIPCVGTHQDGEMQRGIIRSFTDNGDGTITDNVTGLMWEKLSNDGSSHDVDDVFDWQSALSKKTNALNAQMFAGHNDWRLPNITELQTLADFGSYFPATSSLFHDNCAPGCTVLTCSCMDMYHYWSSSTWAGNSTIALVLNMNDGLIYGRDKTLTARVRAVRGGP